MGFVWCPWLGLVGASAGPFCNPAAGGDPACVLRGRSASGLLLLGDSTRFQLRARAGLGGPPGYSTRFRPRGGFMVPKRGSALTTIILQCGTECKRFLLVWGTFLVPIAAAAGGDQGPGVERAPVRLIEGGDGSRAWRAPGPSGAVAPALRRRSAAAAGVIYNSAVIIARGIAYDSITIVYRYHARRGCITIYSRYVIRLL